MGDLGKAHCIHEMMINHQDEHHSIVLEILGNIDGMRFIILIDLGATESFISLNSLSKIKHK